jgi:hypothetical protein
MQVKEKFGGLRIYTQGGDLDAIDTVVRSAESLASITCEECGGSGQLVNLNKSFWMKTLCPQCEKAKQ